MTKTMKATPSWCPVCRREHSANVLCIDGKPKPTPIPRLRSDADQRPAFGRAHQIAKPSAFFHPELLPFAGLARALWWRLRYLFIDPPGWPKRLDALDGRFASKCAAAFEAEKNTAPNLPKTGQAIVVKVSGIEIVPVTADLIAWMEARGHKLAGRTPDTCRLRDELCDQPIFEGLIGPMWGGEDTPLRYEDSAVNDALSC